MRASEALRPQRAAGDVREDRRKGGGTQHRSKRASNRSTLDDVGSLLVTPWESVFPFAGVLWTHFSSGELGGKWRTILNLKRLSAPVGCSSIEPVVEFVCLFLQSWQVNQVNCPRFQSRRLQSKLSGAQTPSNFLVGKSHAETTPLRALVEPSVQMDSTRAIRKDS